MSGFVKEKAKIIARGLSRLFVVPVYLFYLLSSFALEREKNFRGFSQFFSLIPGILGEYLRLEFYRLALKRCSKDCCISFGTIFSTDDVEIGEGVYIGSYCIIGHSRIGRNVLLASRVSILSGLHQHGVKRTDVPIRDQAGTYEILHIGGDAWLGEGAIIGANVGDHAVIGAGSIVVEEIPPYSIVAGNPAQIVRERK
jgi:acetyltransferase-like isoleucine patch superfamily enzyme